MTEYFYWSKDADLDKLPEMKEATPEQLAGLERNEKGEIKVVIGEGSGKYKIVKHEIWGWCVVRPDDDIRRCIPSFAGAVQYVRDCEAKRKEELHGYGHGV